MRSGQFDFRWRCEDVELDARSFYISIDRRNGDAFYDHWVKRRRLPIAMEIWRRGQIKNFTSHYLTRALKNGATPVRSTAGFDVVQTKPATLFDASPLGLFGYMGHKIVFQCSALATKPGHSCRTSYPYDDVIDILYTFIDTSIPEQEWLSLDARVREFLRGLLKDS